jgi:hypothetical protein
LTVYEVAEEVSVSCGICEALLSEDLEIRHVLANFIPQMMTQEQKITFLWLMTLE